MRTFSLRCLLTACVFGLTWMLAAQSASAQIVPGTGTKVPEVGDDFEDGSWSFTFNEPKSSENINKQGNFPGGISVNGRWAESALRGQPDVIRRVATPEGGIPGSKASLVMRSLHTGVPGRLSFEQQQDDLLMVVSNRVGGYIPVQWNPSVVVRVFLPEWKYWEQRTGSSFAMRADLVGEKTEQRTSFFRRGSYTKSENYWPGMFICYNCAKDTPDKKDSAYILIRAGERGEDFNGPIITQTGWWTLGMSFTGDGRVHYYASPGVDDLTAKDYIASRYSYGYHANSFYTAFFNVVNKDDGRSWSTPWIIDDPMIYWRK